MCLYLLNGIDVLLCGLEATRIRRAKTDENEWDEIGVGGVEYGLS